MTLLRRVLLVNAVVLLAAAAALAITPLTVSSTARTTEVVVLVAGAVAVIAFSGLLLRRLFRPLSELAELMDEIDPLEPGRRIEVHRSVAEVARLENAFNHMLDRLEHERRLSARRALQAQERERRRLARELHDELGQALTGVVLVLDGLAREAPPELRPAVSEVQETARAAGEKVRDLARGLRPQALEAFGLRSALASLAAGFEERSGLRVRCEVPPDLPELTPDQELAVYRAAQESLTNVARHAEATAVILSLRRGDDAIALTVADDGVGADPEALHDAGGIGGMRERAMLLGGRLSVGRAAELGGCEVRLELPLEA